MFAALFAVLMLIVVPLASLAWGVDSRRPDDRNWSSPSWGGDHRS